MVGWLLSSGPAIKLTHKSNAKLLIPFIPFSYDNPYFFPVYFPNLIIINIICLALMAMNLNNEENNKTIMQYLIEI
jgi:hypothetical protein